MGYCNPDRARLPTWEGRLQHFERAIGDVGLCSEPQCPAPTTHMHTCLHRHIWSALAERLETMWPRDKTGLLLRAPPLPSFSPSLSHPCFYSPSSSFPMYPSPVITHPSPMGLPGLQLSGLPPGPYAVGLVPHWPAVENRIPRGSLPGF